ncbi:MAG: cytochrome c3 family protein [Spirochaetota bacterium]|nr:cytochrome c3 family protein [Spirochaetota bacterium]
MEKRQLLLMLLGLLLLVFFIGYRAWSHMINIMMPADSRPGEIVFTVDRITPEEFSAISKKISKEYSEELKHIEIFEAEGILEYEGPETCLRCHREIKVVDAHTGKERKEDLMENLTSSAHYRFFTTRHPNVYGFNGKLADNFPMGKINRPCPKPGSFAMTAWAELITTKEGKTLSEGCGQCHIGSQYQAPLGEMMPLYRTLDKEKDAIDCLICHSVAYDMNKKQVVEDDNGLRRWDQDRSMKAAMSVGSPTAQACLRCHQHNMGGDIYIDKKDPSYMQSFLNLGYERPRVLHPGSKRGTPYSPSWDVHARAGMSCIECHTTEGHLIAKGTHTTTMMANDLPDVEVSCEKCHSSKPHSDVKHAEYLNTHIKRIACVTCHIPSLHPDNATMRDFSQVVYEEHPGIYIYKDIKKESRPGKGIVYSWWNGDATFLGNPIGDNPNGKNLYKFYTPEHIWPEFKDFDYDSWYEKTMRPIAKEGRPSKIYAMKLFNGRQHIDLQNMGPFGGMFIPYNFPTYYTTGNPDLAAAKEMEKSMMKRMYGLMFKVYMMDKFMSFMDVDSWNTSSYKDVKNMNRVEPRWIPKNAHLEISHAIRKDGAFSCNACHKPNGALDWMALGYSAEEKRRLEANPL